MAWLYTFLSILLSLSIVFSVLVIRELNKIKSYKAIKKAISNSYSDDSPISKSLTPEEIHIRLQERLARIKSYTEKLKKSGEFSEKTEITWRPKPSSVFYNPKTEDDFNSLLYYFFTLESDKKESFMEIIKSIERVSSKKKSEK